MLEDLFSPPIWRPESCVVIWNLLWLSSGLIIRTDPENIYTSTFPNTLTPKISVYFLTNAILALCHAPP